MKKGLIKDMSSAEYHGLVDENEMYFSSSQLKVIVDDPEEFYKKYISRELPASQDNSAMDVGSYFHTAILEPHKLKEEFAIFTGKVRRGKEWDAFEEENKGKIILTNSMLEQAEILVKAVKDSPIAMSLLTKGNAELSLFTELEGLPVKVRFDYIVLGKDYSYIVDLKSTSGNVKNKFAVQTKVASLQYELSASLYIRAVNQHIANAKLPYAPVKDFYWIFASKDRGSSRTYLASEDHLKIGNKKVDEAIKLLKKYRANGWAFEDEMGICYPPQHQIDDWLTEREEVIPQQEIKQEKAINLLDEI